MSEDQEAIVIPVKRATWKWLLAGSLLVMLLAATVVLFADERLRPCQDLMPSGEPAPNAAENGYLFLKGHWANRPVFNRQGLERLAAITDGTAAMDDAFLASLRKGRENDRKEFQQALAMPAWKVPTLGQAVDREGAWWMTLPPLLFRLDAALALKTGDAGPAVLLHRELALMARRQIESGGGLISLQAGGALQTQAAVICSNVLDTGHPDETILREFSDIWSKDPPMQEAGRQALIRESRSFANALYMLRDGNLTPEIQAEFPFWRRLLIKPNATVNLRNDLFRKLLADLFQPFPDRTSARAAGLGMPMDDRPPLRQMLDPNFFGGKLAREHTSSMVVLRAYQILFVPRAMRVRLAIHRWRLAHPGQWPTDLQELIPDYLPEIPIDPWNGHPLRWEQSERTVYAVGADWKPAPPLFDAGSRAWFSFAYEEPGLRMELPPPPALIPVGGQQQPRRRVVLPPP